MWNGSLAETRLQRLPLPVKTTVSLTLLLLAVGYAIGLLNLYVTYNLTDGRPGLTAEDLKRAFYGDRHNTKLASKIDGGSMAQFLPLPGDREKILSWIQDGTPREVYEQRIEPILRINCIRCHRPGGLSAFRPLTRYEEVKTVTSIDRGEPVQLWAKVAHSHVQSIALNLLVLGLVFSFSSLPQYMRMTVILVPFAALLTDFATRYLARHEPNLVYVMILSGAALALSFAFMVAVSLYEMWVKE